MIFQCPNCQLQFISNDHLTYHFKSYSHKEVISGQYLPKIYNCYVCLKGFDIQNDWFEHCQDKSHFQMLSWCGIKSDVQSAADNTTSDIFEAVNSPEKLEEVLEPVDSPEQHISDSEEIDNVKVVKVKVENFDEESFENVSDSPDEEDEQPSKFHESLEYVDPDSPEIIDEEINSPEIIDLEINQINEDEEAEIDFLNQIKEEEAEIDTFENVDSPEETTNSNNITAKKPKPRMKLAEGPNGACIFCEKNKHRYQLYCPKLKQMQPNEIYSIMKKAGIECQMCLGLGHSTRNCPAAKMGILKKCSIFTSIKENDTACGMYHCRYLHKTKKENTNDNNTEEILDIETKEMCLICKVSPSSVCFKSLCKKCGKLGHANYHCPNKKRKKHNKGVKARLRKLEYKERLDNVHKLVFESTSEKIIQKDDEVVGEGIISPENISEDFEPVDSPEQIENCDDEQPTDNFKEENENSESPKTEKNIEELEEIVVKDDSKEFDGADENYEIIPQDDNSYMDQLLDNKVSDVKSEFFQENNTNKNSEKVEESGDDKNNAEVTLEEIDSSEVSLSDVDDDQVSLSSLEDHTIEISNSNVEKSNAELLESVDSPEEFNDQLSDSDSDEFVVLDQV